MKRLTLVSAILASVCSIAAVAAQRNQTQFVLQDAEGSQLQAGDALVADGAGKVALYRGNSFVVTLNDPEDLVGRRGTSTTPLYVTDAQGNAVRGDLASFSGDLFVSAEAPQIVMPDRASVVAREASRKAAGHGGHGGGSSPLMTAHGGTVLTSNKTMAIFWGTSWTTYTGDIITGIDSFFRGWGGSGIAGDSTEYAGTNGQVSATSTYLGYTIDTSTVPTKALSTSQAVAEACKIANNNPDPLGVYFIYTSTGAGHVSYCAWHSWGTCSNGAQVQVAYMPNITGIAGCDPGSTVAGQSEGLAALANVTSHELSEAITDPRGAGWFDSSGAENGDKCAWAFNGDVTLNNGSTWLLQGEWSNAAYTANSGYPNLSGQNGCLN
ncbi:MAG TPA: hypothetical protein VLB69_08560 [Rudaea sp.]|nr:hypothetical protein [Rudaea sp.]